MEPQENELVFTAYLEETLSVSDRKAFEQRLQEDPSFRDDFYAFKTVYSALENRFSAQRADVLQSIQQADARFKISKNQNDSHGKSIRFKPWHYAVAASIILAVGLFLFNGFGKPTYSEFATHEPISLTLRSDNATTTKQAEQAFNTGDYAEAELQFDKLLQKNPETVEYQFYKAQALVEQDKFDEAEIILKDISEGNSVYASEARWWNALGKLKQKKYDEAKNILKSIDANTDAYNKAQELLQEL
ncbi:tetratricopeptide repeat protein [Marixanthomonas spongiae]|uniref:Tetratricopeptide repeat protein n=1 Tax=Marixanthomonas spongiae TaxID=2174845 RepID=A0A2U0HZB8_9FLAO|nr:tetratricopeptide repeat protein [Marixanthomonas spongiae]PVW14215.1 hypothetical protein DDV96_10425 [Marixanthomonas spongiae]